MILFITTSYRNEGYFPEQSRSGGYFSSATSGIRISGFV